MKPIDPEAMTAAEHRVLEAMSEAVCLLAGRDARRDFVDAYRAVAGDAAGDDLEQRVHVAWRVRTEPVVFLLAEQEPPMPSELETTKAAHRQQVETLTRLAADRDSA